MQLTQVTVEKVESSLVAMEVEISAQDVEQAVKAVYRDLAQRTPIPGFRKGKAPKEILKRHAGVERFRRAVVDRLIPPAYDQVVKDQNLVPLEQASVENVEFDEGKPLRFKARVLVKPEVTLGAYKGIPVLKPKVTVTDEEIEQQLSALRESHADFNSVEERGIQKGDVVTIELEVYLGGELYKEGRQTLRPFVVGDNALTPSVDDSLIGMRAGEERRFPVTYPPDFNDAELAGKEAEFLVHVVSVREKIVPALTDEFAKEVSEDLNTVDELREWVRQRLTELKAAQAAEQVRQQVVNAVVANAVVDVPDRLVERRATRKWRDVEQELERRRLTLEDFARFRNVTMDELRAEYRAEAERELRQELVLEAVAQRENITVTPEEMQPQIEALARAMQQRPADLQAQMVATAMISAVESTVRERKTVDWLVSVADVKEEEERGQLVNESIE
jgi:trigger factor